VEKPDKNNLPVEGWNGCFYSAFVITCADETELAAGESEKYDNFYFSFEKRFLKTIKICFFQGIKRKIQGRFLIFCQEQDPFPTVCGGTDRTFSKDGKECARGKNPPVETATYLFL